MGVFLFNSTTDDLEDDFLRSENVSVDDDDYDVLPEDAVAWTSPTPVNVDVRTLLDAGASAGSADVRIPVRDGSRGSPSMPSSPAGSADQPPTASTPDGPTLGQLGATPDVSPVGMCRQFRWVEGINFEFLPGARNVGPGPRPSSPPPEPNHCCLLYTSDAADE